MVRHLRRNDAEEVVARLNGAAQHLIDDLGLGNHALLLKLLDGGGKRVAGRAEKLVGFGTGELQCERELDRRSLRDGTVRVRDDGGPRAAVDPGRVVRKGRVAMALALDMACADLVNKAMTIPGSVADVEGEKDVFTRIHPNTKWKVTIDQAVKMGVGTTNYELTRL